MNTPILTIHLPSHALIQSPSKHADAGDLLQLVAPSGEVVFSAHAHEFARRPVATMERLITRLRPFWRGEKLERGGWAFPLGVGRTLFIWPDCALVRDAEMNEVAGCAWFEPDWRRDGEGTLLAFVTCLADHLPSNVGGMRGAAAVAA